MGPTVRMAKLPADVNPQINMAIGRTQELIAPNPMIQTMQPDIVPVVVDFIFFPINS